MSYFKRLKEGVKKVVNDGTTYLASPKGLEQVSAAGKKISSFLPFQAERNIANQFTQGAVGRTVGGLVGKGIGLITGNAQKGSDIGSKFGESVLGFKKGGRVKKSGKYLVHKREFIVPKKTPVTKKQRAKVSKRNKL